MKEKIITFILTLMIIVILGVIGTIAYFVYIEVTEEGTIEIDFESEAGFPTIKYTPSKNNSIEIDEELFAGVESTNNSINKSNI